jgi:aspartyl-tRNA(Asn)/glutamyl-tRNA(Gln) amidotransferase subunit C
LTLEQVRHVAALARLSLSPEEEQRFVTQLSAILDAMKALGEVDTTGVEPMFSPLGHEVAGAVSAAQGSGLREDVVTPSFEPDRGLRNAPERVGTSFAVPKILE